MAHQADQHIVRRHVKTRIPTLATEVIPRPRLLALLEKTAHTKLLLVQAPAGLQAPDATEVDVPATGRVAGSVRVWRSSAPRGSRQRLLVLAEPMGGAGPAASQQVFAEILPDPAWMPRLRRPLGVLALLLMAAAALLELSRGRQARN